MHFGRRRYYQIKHSVVVTCQCGRRSLSWENPQSAIRSPHTRKVDVGVECRERAILILASSGSGVRCTERPIRAHANVNQSSASTTPRARTHRKTNLHVWLHRTVQHSVQRINRTANSMVRCLTSYDWTSSPYRGICCSSASTALLASRPYLVRISSDTSADISSKGFPIPTRTILLPDMMMARLCSHVRRRYLPDQRNDCIDGDLAGKYVL